MLADPRLVGTALVTLPEELPVEETLEFLPKLSRDLGRAPQALFVNRSILPFVEKHPLSMNSQHVMELWKSRLQTSDALRALGVLHRDLRKRQHFEETLRHACGERAPAMPVISVPDIGLSKPEAGAPAVLQGVTEWLLNENEKVLALPTDHTRRDQNNSASCEISEDQR